MDEFYDQSELQHQNAQLRNENTALKRMLQKYSQQLAELQGILQCCCLNAFSSLFNSEKKKIQLYVCVQSCAICFYRKLISFINITYSQCHPLSLTTERVIVLERTNASTSQTSPSTKRKKKADSKTSSMANKRRVGADRKERRGQDQNSEKVTWFHEGKKKKKKKSHVTFSRIFDLSITLLYTHTLSLSMYMYIYCTVTLLDILLLLLLLLLTSPNQQNLQQQLQALRKENSSAREQFELVINRKNEELASLSALVNKQKETQEDAFANLRTQLRDWQQRLKTSALKYATS